MVMQRTESVLLPSRQKQATLVDLLDRVLEKGVVISADIIISVAGIPLIGINLRAALAGMETMLKYGMMRDWDERTRAWERKHPKKREPPLLADEEVLLRMYGAHWYQKGIYRSWRPGHFYLTNRRLLLFRKGPGEVLFEAYFERIEGLAIRRETHFTGVERDMIYLLRNSDRVAYLYAERPGELTEAIKERMKALGLPLDESPIIPVIDEEVDSYLGEDEISAEAKMWYEVPASGIFGKTWRAGRLYLTNERLFWWCNEDRKALFDVPLAEIVGTRIETRDLGGLIKETPVFIVSCSNARVPVEALFAGDKLAEWEAALGRIMGEMDTCPQCGRCAATEQLLERGCPYCGWTSPRLKKKELEAKPTAAK